MIDFLKAFPFVTKDEYLWQWTVPQILLASADNSRVLYLSEEEARERESMHYDGSNLSGLNDFGVPIFDKE